jgi:hypothetical protein
MESITNKASIIADATKYFFKLKVPFYYLFINDNSEVIYILYKGRKKAKVKYENMTNYANYY